tara:strand:+ start:1282 stop:2565 length:1284 start_codon:yes stop_codon:yes gene_type:complete
MTKVVEEKTHAKLSPSGAKRWMSCPGSIRLAEKLNVVDKTSKYAAEGTVAHEVGELCLLNHKDPEDYRGQVIEADGMKFTVNSNMIEAVTEYTEYVRGRIGHFEALGYRVELQVEVWCPLDSLGIPGMDGGTSDTMLLMWKDINGVEVLCEIEVIDYKHGQGVPVEIEDNSQLMSYGLGSMHHAKLDDMDDCLIHMTIVQPRAHHPDGRIRSTSMESSNLFHWQDTQLVPAALLTQEPDAPFKASDSACRFCKVAGQCRALQDTIQEEAIADFKDEALPDPEVMTTEQKLLVMEHAAMWRGFIVAVENQVKLEVDGGSKDYEEKFKLVRGKSNRKLNGDYDDEFNTLMEYLSEDDLFKKVPLPIGDIEGILSSKLGKIPKKKLKIKEIMDEVTTKPEGKLVIAPISDKRSAVLAAITSDFADIEDDL